jgi:gluconate 2-dehydrogenase gamma chain
MEGRMERISRRSLLKGVGAAAATVVVGACDGRARQDANEPLAYTFLTPDEAAFMEPAVARLIPSDETGPGALEAGVPTYIDRQLAGPWGAGEQLYRSGPWHTAEAEFGYQLRFTPSELFRNALRAISDDLRKSNRGSFRTLTPEQQDAYLRALDKESRDLGGVPSGVFFESLLEMTIEGFFCDPAYGGNKDMVAWKLIGFPGAYANYYELVDQHGIAFMRPPMSLAQDARGTIHLHPVRQTPKERR